jgi:mRNA interferase RelE/StbE
MTEGEAMNHKRFAVIFAPLALDDYNNLDGSVRKLVNKKLEDLEERADEIGKILSGDLAGYREIKLREAGIRIIYRITDQKIDIFTIVTIGKRESDQVFKVAVHRIQNRKITSTIRWHLHKK